MKGKQRETSKFCLRHGERTEIHGMFSNVEHTTTTIIVIFSRQQRIRWRFRFLSLRQHWSRIWTTRVGWLRLLQGKERRLHRWSRISRCIVCCWQNWGFDSLKTRIFKASSWQWRKMLKSKRINCDTLHRWIPLEHQKKAKKNDHSG